MAPSIRSLLTASLLALAPFASASRELTSTSLATCQENSQFSASLFDIALTPGNGSLTFAINGVSTITGYVLLNIQVWAYGLSVYNGQIDPCEDAALKGLCPMQEGPIQLPPSVVTIPSGALSGVPGK